MRLSPSGSALYLGCSGGAILNHSLDTPSENQLAEEGTFAHKVAEVILLSGVAADKFEYVITYMLEATHSNIVLTSTVGEMADYLSVYVDYVRKRIRERPSAKLYIEVQLPGIEGTTPGTADAVIFDESGGYVEVVDLKYGKNVRVDPNSPQLKVYALAAMDKFKMSTGDVYTTIVQPRMQEDPVTVQYSAYILEDFRDEVSESMANITRLVKSGEIPTASLTPSEKACKWCAAKNVCPVRAKPLYDTISLVLEDTTKVNLKEYAESEYSKLADLVVRYKAVASSVDAMEKKLLSIIASGESVAGFGVTQVRGRKGFRAGVTTSNVKSWLLDNGIDSEVTVNTMKSMTDILKLIPTKSGREAFQHEFTAVKPGKLKLASLGCSSELDEV